MMKKTLVFIACTALLSTGCSLNQLTNAVESVEQAVNSTTTTSTPAPTASPAPKETTLSLGKKASVGNWKICLKKMAVKKKIKDGKYHYYKAGKGKTFLLFSLSVKNNGKTAEDFLPRVGYANKMVKAVLLYKKKYEYSPSELLSYDKDLVTAKIQPLCTEHGVIAFEVPNKVAKQKKQVTLKFSTKTEHLLFTLQKKK